MQSWPIFRRPFLPILSLSRAGFFLKIKCWLMIHKLWTHQMLIISAIHAVLLPFFGISPGPQCTSTYRNTTKRIVDQFQFFLLFQMMEHFWKSNEIYIFQNCSYYAIHDFHSLTQKHLCHLVFHLWPIEKDLTGMLPHLWPLSTLFSPHHKLLSAILWEFYHPDFEKSTVSIER